MNAATHIKLKWEEYMVEHRARKRFGQNFLVNEQVIERIVDVLNPTSSDHLVEIGAGLGALTDRVLAHVKKLHVIEIDRDLVALLRQRYDENRLIIHEGDVLKFDFSTLIAKATPLRIFGNLPYNISTPILFHLLQYANQIQDLTFMLQKEVVDRLAAMHSQSDYGRLTIMIQYACRVIRLFDISPSAFSPPPKVISSMVKLIPYGENRPHPLAKDYGHFAQTVNTAFQHRRKTLTNALGKTFPLAAFEAAGLQPQQRPETVTVAQFVMLSNFKL